MARRRRQGFSLVEAVLVLALLAGVLAFGLASFHPGSVTRAARDLAVAIRHARWAAVAEGRPVVLLAAVDGSVARLAGAEYACGLAGAGRIVWERRTGVAIAWPSRGLAFAPDGRPRRCDGSGVGNATVDVLGRSGDRAAVIVAVTGRVRWERR